MTAREHALDHGPRTGRSPGWGSSPARDRRRSAPSPPADASGAGAEPRGTRRGWVQLGLWIAGIVLFMYVLAPAAKQWEPWGTLCRFITERGIEANAYYYTENEEFFEAHRALTNKMTYQQDGFTKEEGF